MKTPIYSMPNKGENVMPVDYFVDDIFFAILLAIPIIFLILCIKNIIRIVKPKKGQTATKKSLTIKAVIFGTISIVTMIFYILVLYMLSEAVANM